VYWPLVVIVPGPEFASPPVTAHVTLAAPPPVSEAVNCSTGVPAELVELQPVQLVSIAGVLGATENVPLDEVVVVVDPLTQPVRTSTAGSKLTANTRAGQSLETARTLDLGLSLNE
jgi:hypothetical protein